MRGAGDSWVVVSVSGTPPGCRRFRWIPGVSLVLNPRLMASKPYDREKMSFTPTLIFAL